VQAGCVLPLVPVLALRRTDRGSRVLPPNRRAGAGGRTRACRRPGTSVTR